MSVTCTGRREDAPGQDEAHHPAQNTSPISSKDASAVTTGAASTALADRSALVTPDKPDNYTAQTNDGSGLSDDNVCDDDCYCSHLYGGGDDAIATELETDPTTKTKKRRLINGHAESYDAVSRPADAVADGPAVREATTCSVSEVRISRKDGDHEVVYTRNTEFNATLDKLGDKPRFFGKARQLSKGIEGSLPHHCKTNDPCLPKSIAKKVCTRVKCPDGNVDYRVEILDRDAGDSHLATVIWVPYHVLDEGITSTLGLTDENWPRGKAKETFRSAYMKVRDHKDFNLSGKCSASGEYAEAGYGTGSGSQTTSINVGQQKGALLPYLRHPQFSTDVEGDLGNAMGSITLYLQDQHPDLLQGLQENGDSTINRGLSYPRPDQSGPLSSAPATLTNQVALRLVGAPKGGHANRKRKLLAMYGGSGLHVDSTDPDSRFGSLTAYICFNDDADPNLCREENRRRFKYTDLAVFQTKRGGRAAVIEVMKPGHVCLVFHHPSLHLHGSVFPNKGKAQPLFDGFEGMKIVCYQVLQHKQILKLAKHCHESPEIFNHYVHEHNRFREKAQRKGRKNNALCHYAPFARVLQELVAEIDSKRDRNEHTTQFEEERAYEMSSLLWSVSHSLRDLRNDNSFYWSNVFVDYAT